MPKKKAEPKVAVKFTREEIELILNTLTEAKQTICTDKREAIDGVSTTLVFAQFGFSK